MLTITGATRFRGSLFLFVEVTATATSILQEVTSTFSPLYSFIQKCRNSKIDLSIHSVAHYPRLTCFKNICLEWSKSRPCERRECTGSIHRFITRIECNLNDHDFGLCGLEPQMTEEEEIFVCAGVHPLVAQCEKVTFFQRAALGMDKRIPKKVDKNGRRKCEISSKIVNSKGHRANQKVFPFPFLHLTLFHSLILPLAASLFFLILLYELLSSIMLH